jgi:hypothetical protein
MHLGVCFFPPTFHNFDFLVLKVVKSYFGLLHILKGKLCLGLCILCVCVFVKVFACLKVLVLF